MTENQKLALIAAAAPNTVLRWNGWYYVACKGDAMPTGGDRGFSMVDTLQSVAAGLLRNLKQGIVPVELAITEAGRRAVEEMVKK